jgi:uncharacterized membrane protein YwaF
VAISYYWGLTLNPQAIITPHPSILVVPSVDFVLYWVLHITVFVAPLVLVWGDRLAATVARLLAYLRGGDRLGHGYYAD